MSYLSQILILLVSFAFVSCDDGSFATFGEDEKKIINPNLSNGTSEGDSEALIPAFRSSYNFIAKLKILRTKVCDGKATITAFSDLSNKFGGVIPCTGGRDIDLSAEAHDRQFTPADVAKQLPLFGYFTRTSSTGTTVYNPPIIDMLTPTINNAGEYAGKFSDEALTVSKVLADGTKKEFSGRMITKVESVGSFDPEDYSESLPSVIHWKRTFEDFDKEMNFGDFGLFEEMEFWINTKPFIVSQIIIRGKVSDFVSQPGPEETEEDFTAKLGLNLEVKMTLTDHQEFEVE